MMKPDAAVALVKEYVPVWRKNRERMDMVDRWHRGDLNEQDKPSMPNRPTKEYRELRDRSISKFLKLAVTALAQSMYIDGYRQKGASDNTPAWSCWQANRWDARQIAVNRGMLSLGLSYVTVLPGALPDGTSMPVWRGMSARRMTTFWQDVAADEWPMHALEGEAIHGRDGRSHWRWRLWDDEAIYTVDSDSEAGKFTFITLDQHNVGVCPVVRYANDLDLDGRSDGEVEPNIQLASRIDQDTFDRLVVQRFGAWVVRTIAGMVMPGTAEEKRAERLRLSIEDFLASDSPDTKFGTLQGTPLDGFIKAKEADVYEFGATMQVPASDLIGQMINLSAEALAAGEAGKTRKITERKQTAGESAEQQLRLTAHLMGDAEGAADFEAQVVWRDMESRSLSTVADALGKLAQMLDVPKQALWDRIPGVTQRDVEEWKQIAEGDGDGLDGLMRQLAGGQTSDPDVAAANVVKAKADAMGVLIRSGVSTESAALQVGLEGVVFTGAVPVSLRLPETEANQLEQA